MSTCTYVFFGVFLANRFRSAKSHQLSPGPDSPRGPPDARPQNGQPGQRDQPHRPLGGQQYGGGRGGHGGGGGGAVQQC